MTGPVDIGAAPRGDADGQRIEALDQAHGVGIGVIGLQGRQAAGQDTSSSVEKSAAPLPRKIGRQLLHARPRPRRSA